jgi:hypothetical protein
MLADTTSFEAYRQDQRPLACSAIPRMGNAYTGLMHGIPTVPTNAHASVTWHGNQVRTDFVRPLL